jgi:alpha-L-rhamnosidase
VGGSSRVGGRDVRITFVLTALGAALAFGTAPALAAPGSLTVEHQAQPLAVEPVAPELGWADDADQSAYEIRVASSADKLTAAPDVWDSGKVDSSASANIAYGGPALASSTRYFWTVRTWDRSGAAGAWAAPASFGTAVKSDWRGTPIWTSVPTLGTDYRLDADFTVTAVALGVKFRANGGNGFMWQIRGDSSNELRPHVEVNGTYTQMKAVKLPMTIGINVPHHVTISAAGSTLTTYIDGTLVDTTTDTRNPSGSIGFRTGSTESGTVDDVKVTSTAGDVLYSQDFNGATADFAGCGAVTGGSQPVGKGKDCTYGPNDNWAFLRRTFAVADKPIAWATAYVTARSTEPAHQYVYKLSVNGTFVGVGPSRAKTDATMTTYNAYDVTSLLERGRSNAIGALAYTTSDKRFLAQLVIAYADGSRDVVSSDGTWTSFPGSQAMPEGGSIGTSFYAAPVENIDARVYPSGFDTAGFDDSKWTPAVTKAAMPGLTGLPQAAMTQQLVPPVKITKVADKHYILDFGHSVVGGLQLSLNGSGGEQVEIRDGEVLSSPTAVDYTLSAGNAYRDVWTLRPGFQTLSMWGFRVFRYAEVIGADVDMANVRAAALVYPYDPTASSWSSSSSALDQVFGFSKTGVEALNMDMHVDSPTRERGPYEGDDLINMLVQGYDDGDWTESRYTLQWLIQDKTWPAEWRFASILSAYEYWQATGDIVPLRDDYAALKALLPTQYINKDGLVEKAPGSSSSANADLVDWPDGERDGYVFTTINTVINSWSYRAFADMADVASALGNASDAATFNTYATNLKTAINTKLWDPASGAYDDGLTTTHKAVHASVFAVAMGVAGPDQIGPATQYIANRGMVCSVFCANFLVTALYDGGRADDAVRMLTGTGQRSWLHMIDQGAGSPMEAWDPALKSNTTYSHPWAGSPAYLVYRGAMGIQPLTPGYARFAIKPQPGSLTHAEAVTPTQHGPIAVAFDTTHGFDVAVSVPANTTGVLTLPSGTVELGSGCHLIGATSAATLASFAAAHGCSSSTAVGGGVPATLALTLGAPASFGTFAPGVAKTYDATTTADVVSTAGDAALSWSGSNHLANGAFTLPQPFTVDVSKSTWSAPVSHDAVTIGLHQPIAATDALRTGSYSKTLTHTLSPTTP